LSINGRSEVSEQRTPAPDTMLKRAERIHLELRSAGDATATLDGQTVEVGMHGLALLAACTEPSTIRALVDGVAARSRRDFAEIAATLKLLIDNGLLLGADTPLQKTDQGTWAHFPTHIGLLDDELRTAQFLAAIRAQTTADDIVLDIGSGTGVMAVGAALAGAKHVYAMEASAMAGTVRELARANGVADRVTVLQGWSTRLELPTKATLLVTETIGNDPLGEHIVDIVADAKKRLLTKDARIIPHEISVYAYLASVPDELADYHRFGAGNTSRWSRDYGIDFSVLAQVTKESLATSFEQREAACLRELSEPVLVGGVDFETPLVSSTDFTLVANAAGRFDAVVSYFEVALAPGITLSTRPSIASPTNSWLTRLWLESAPRWVAYGEVIRLRARFAHSSVVIEQPT
jgi:16S rRNA G966 N2-methylase RsmD